MLRGVENLQQTTAVYCMLIEHVLLLQEYFVSARNTSILYNEHQTYLLLKPTDEEVDLWAMDTFDILFFAQLAILRIGKEIQFLNFI